MNPDQAPELPTRQSFRPSPLVRVPVLLGLLFWVATAVLTLTTAGIPPRIYAALGFFILFFLAFCLYYFRMAIVVDEYGITYRGAVEFNSFSWEEIVNLQVDVGMAMTDYDVQTREGTGLRFNSIIAGHRRLARIITERAMLCRGERA